MVSFRKTKMVPLNTRLHLKPRITGCRHVIVIIKATYTGLLTYLETLGKFKHVMLEGS